MKYNDGHTNSRWAIFQEKVADELMARKLVASREEAEHFAEALDLSFEQDYNPVHMDQWDALIKRDADEYEKDQNREA
ncbi:hypothetical protein IME_EC2_13 [Enterobacteria phage IME_EC2]|uniref:Uncharacterized protein n=2 Tax=Murrayvirus EC2 TaxID=2734259 RepID=A0A0A0P380_9CAUD|nr:hypothetical protein HOQ93_gp13 [Enterobacteria phage IME_EC2]AGZ17804.1 hypothetical protein IME_EC2_13 [Enterobacteria phage IME_EC2]QHR72879.1 hypothetical protein sortsyn_14 [Escherichia phage sortsyn]